MEAPSAEILLAIDREYRDKAAARCLRLVAPRRLNPDEKPWLPVLHTRYGPWHFTALFSNTEPEREVHRTKDWVVIYFCADDDDEDGQVTVVTERRGALTGSRVVRGREPECARYYRTREARANMAHA
jgi:hypothetical protein